MARRSKYGIRGRWRWDPETKELVQIKGDQTQQQPAGPYVRGDIPDYVSPATGKVVSGRRQQREDLKRSGCRIYEGREQEQQAVERRRAELERREDQAAERAAHEVWSHMPERVRRPLSGR